MKRVEDSKEGENSHELAENSSNTRNLTVFTEIGGGSKIAKKGHRGPPPTHD